MFYATNACNGRCSGIFHTRSTTAKESNDMGILITKDGFPITATVETVISTCRIISAERDEDGLVILEYGDEGSEVHWDSAEQIKRHHEGSTKAEPVYQTEDGEEYLECDLELVEADEDDFCRGCGRYGPICSRQPCPAVIADRAA
jgi:hypothetical protein